MILITIVEAKKYEIYCYVFKKTTSMGFMNAREKVIMIKQLVDTWTMDQLIAAETTDEERLDQLLALIVKK